MDNSNIPFAQGTRRQRLLRHWGGDDGDGKVFALAALLLVVSSVALSWFLDLPQIALSVGILLGWAAWQKKRSAWSMRKVAYGAAGILVWVWLSNRLLPFDVNRMQFFAEMARPAFLNYATLAAAAAVLLFNRRYFAIGMAAGSSFYTVFSLGGMNPAGLQAQTARLPGNLFLQDSYVSILCVLAGLLAGLTVWGAVAAAKMARPAARGNPRWSLALRLGTLGALVATWGLLTMWHEKYNREIRAMEMNLIQMSYAMPRPENGSFAFIPQSDLRSFPGRSPREEAHIVMRIYSSHAPGYLRIYAYTEYENGVWKPPRTPRENPDAPAELSLPGAPSGEWSKILWSAGFSSASLAVPANWSAIVLPKGSLHLLPNGVIGPEGWPTSLGYQVRFAEAPEGTVPAWQLPTDPGPEYTRVPVRLEPILKEFLAPQSAALAQADSATAVAEVLRKGLWERCRYSLEATAREGEPLADFLTVNRAGHCELFATALTLELRSLDIPARYVSGYMANKTDPGGNYYVARVRNAHAWLEYFDRQRGEWLGIDATPPDGRPDALEDSWSPLEVWRERFSEWYARIRSWFSDLFHCRLDAQSWQTGLGILLAVVFGIRYAPKMVRRWRAKRQRDVVRRNALRPEQRHWQQQWEKQRTRWERLARLAPDPTRSPRELYRRLEEAQIGDRAEREKLRHFIARYERGRFGAESAPPESRG